MLQALRKLILSGPAPTDEKAAKDAFHRWDDLPVELQLEVVKHLAPADVLQLSATRKKNLQFLANDVFRDRYLTHPWYMPNPDRAAPEKPYFERFRKQANYDLKRLKETVLALAKLSAPTRVTIHPRGYGSHAIYARDPQTLACIRALKSQVVSWSRTVVVARGGFHIKL
jgi:hypothetical protein